MKRRVLPLLLILAMVLALLPARALGADLEDYPVIKSNFNGSAVQNDPNSYISITVPSSVWLWSITTYHWNNGRGASPGTISIERDGVIVGTWKATGRSGSGVSNVLWDVYPDYILEPGHEYVIRDSDEATWSWNSGTGGAGMMEFRGASQRPSNLPSSSTPSSSSKPANTTTVDGYTCAPWAVEEISKASNYGLIPTSLSGGDLTRPISRRDFAVVSLLTYCRMGKTAAPDAGSNPFKDTSDPDVLRAYQVGIVDGTSATTFSPNDNLTREQASTMLTRVYKKIVLPGWTLAADSSFSLNYTPSGSFADQRSISAFAADSVSFMAAKGIVNGVGNNTFAPKNNVTRQEALAIAVRMTENLDTTPQAQPPEPPQPPASNGSEGPAQGTLTNDDLTVTFVVNQKGEAVLTKDGSGYDLLLTDMPDGEVQISLPAQAPEEDMEAVIYMGIPYRDSGGKEGFETFALDTSYANGRATASVTLSDYENAIAEVAYDTTASGKTDISAEFAKRQAAAVGSKINVGIAVYIFCETEYFIKSDAGHFKIYIPISTYNKGLDAVAGKLNKQDGKRIVEELEGLLSYYQKTYTIKRTDWPMKVIYTSGDEGQYGSGQMKLNWKNTSNGYGRDIDSSQKMYQTMAHELFHFVQREYTPVALSQSWFDEAAGTYYGIQLGKERCGNLSAAIRNENYFVDAPAQYDGFAPQDIATLGWFDFLHAGYGRASVIDYLMRYYGSDFLKRYYDEGITLAGIQTEARLEKLTGKTMGQLASDFYYKMVLEKDSVVSVLSTPSDIFDRSYSGGTGPESLDRVRTTWTLSGENESTVISVPRYGAYFTALDMTKISPNAKSFTLTVPTADCSAWLVAIRDNTGDSQYTTQKIYTPSDGRFTDIPIDGTKYLLMMVNTVSGWGWTVSETLNMSYTKYSDSGSYPRSFDELPTLFSGSLNYWSKGVNATQTLGKTGVQCMVSESGGSLTFTISGHGGDPIKLTGKGFFDSSGQFRFTADKNMSAAIQMKGGKYVDRSNGPKPTADQLKEWNESPNPFVGHTIKGENTTNEIRILYYDAYGNMAVFEGSGTNDNSYYYEPAITDNPTVDDSGLETAPVVVAP